MQLNLTGFLLGAALLPCDNTKMLCDVLLVIIGSNDEFSFEHVKTVQVPPHSGWHRGSLGLHKEARFWLREPSNRINMLEVYEKVPQEVKRGNLNFV